MKRLVRTTAALLLGAGLSLAAQAGLQINGLFISASALVTPPSGQTSGQTWFWDSALGLPVQVVSSGITTGGLAAAARQTPDGFFHDQVGFTGGWGATPGLSTMHASTEFSLSVSTDTPNTPLLLDFHFLGSELMGSAYYGEGSMTVGTSLAIASSRTNVPTQDVWAFEDRLLLNSSTGSGFVRQSNGSDAQGIGLPQDQAWNGWFEMQTRGTLSREAMLGQLDFGLLQPGETFTLSYRATAWIDSNIRYAGSARALLVDPFSLGGTPPAQFSLQGLELPAAPVPEPPVAALLLAGVAWLLHRRRQG